MYFQDQGIILTRKDFKEKDLLVSVYTEKYGKIKLQSRGAKNIKSKLSGHLEPGSLSTLNWVVGKNIPQLTGAVLKDSFSEAKQDYQKSYLTLKILHLVDQIVGENLADQKIFILLFKTLKSLEKETNLDIVYLVFGFKLLEMLGLNPSQKISSTEKILVDSIIAGKLQQSLENSQVSQNKKKLLKTLDQHFQQIF